MNPKIQKLTEDIAKLDERIRTLQARRKELTRKKTELENSEVIALFNSIDIEPGDLADFIAAYRAKEEIGHEV